MRNSRNRYFGSRDKENKFYTKPDNGGIIKKSLLGVDEIKQSIEAAERRAKTYENEWLDSVVNNAEQRQIDAAKARMEQAKSSVVSLNEQLSDAYGLGEDGYWNTQRTARSAQMENNPDHAYAIGNSTTAAKPQSAYAAGTKAATAQPKTQGQTAAQNSSNTSTKSRRMEWDIAQIQDEIVNGQDLSDYRKGQLNDKLAKLTAQKEVLDWENTKTGTPTAADYEVQENYYQRLWNQNQDDIVNGLGNNTLVQGSDEWYDILKKGDDLLEKRDAYRMGKMGMLDGDDSTDTSATAKGGGGFGTDVNLDANDTMMYAGQPGVDDGENQSMFGTTPPEPMSEEEKLKREIEETFASIQGMTKPEKIAFIKSDGGKEYQRSLEQLEELLGALLYADYIKELFGAPEEETTESAIQDIFEDEVSDIWEDTNIDGKDEDESETIIDALPEGVSDVITARDHATTTANWFVDIEVLDEVCTIFDAYGIAAGTTTMIYYKELADISKDSHKRNYDLIIKQMEDAGVSSTDYSGIMEIARNIDLFPVVISGDLTVENYRDELGLLVFYGAFTDLTGTIFGTGIEELTVAAGKEGIMVAVEAIGSVAPTPYDVMYDVMDLLNTAVDSSPYNIQWVYGQMK